MSDFWQETISPGYYDQILQKGLKKERGIQSNWHRSTFIEVSSFINSKDIHLDYACGPGTFSGIFLETNSIGVDISDAQIKYANQTYGKKDKFLSLEEFNKTMSNKKFDVVTVCISIYCLWYILISEYLIFFSFRYNLSVILSKIIYSLFSINLMVYIMY